MKESFFSIIITAYNSEKYIKRCISSLLNQNFGDYEIIIIDDCSTDNTPDVVKNLQKDYPCIRYFRNEKNL